MAKIVAGSIFNRINAHHRGWVFIPTAFVDIGSRAAIDQTLSRLVVDGKIRRLARGVYYYPKFHPKLGELQPNVDDIVRAVLKDQGYKTQVSEAMAANMLGISTQVPAQTVYYTDATSRVIHIGKLTITFNHATSKGLLGAGTLAGIVIQALRYLGADRVTDIVLKKIAKVLDDKSIKDLQRLKSQAFAWMQTYIDRLVHYAELA